MYHVHDDDSALNLVCRSASSQSNLTKGFQIHKHTQILPMIHKSEWEMDSGLTDSAFNFFCPFSFNLVRSDCFWFLTCSTTVAVARTLCRTSNDIIGLSTSLSQAHKIHPRSNPIRITSLLCSWLENSQSVHPYSVWSWWVFAVLFRIKLRIPILVMSSWCECCLKMGGMTMGVRQDIEFSDYTDIAREWHTTTQYTITTSITKTKTTSRQKHDTKTRQRDKREEGQTESHRQDRTRETL